MSSPAPSRPDCRTLSLFIDELTGSVSAPHSGRHRTVGLCGGQSDSPTASETPTGRPSACLAQDYVHSPTVRPETPVATLRMLLTEMGADIDEVAIAGYPIPYIGWDLRQHYGRVIKKHGLDAAVADATTRYWLQAECASVADLPNLDYPVRPAPHMRAGSETPDSRKFRRSP